MVAHRLGQDEAYFTVREILAEASTAADGVLWREHSDFGRCGFATLGLVRLGTNTLWLPGGTPILVVSRQQLIQYPG